MAKTFSPLNMESANYWSDEGSNPFTPAKIDTIQDPNGDDAKKTITSIPSPFARLNLVDIAFERILKQNIIKGNTVYHKIISDCLDVAQIMFEFNRLHNVEIVIWDKNKELEKIRELDSYDDGLEVLSNTLNTFIASDFSECPDFKLIFLLKYEDEENGVSRIIGGTSPSSLCFSTANDMSDIDITLGQRKAFQDTQALYERDPDFIKYMAGIYKLSLNKTRECKVMARYIDENLKLVASRLDGTISKEDKNQINKVQDQGDRFFKEYRPLTVSGTQVCVGNTLFYQRPDATDIISAMSDFRVDSSFTIQGRSPLIIPNERINSQWRYTTSPWNDEWTGLQSPPSEEMAYDQRKLPYVNDKYPYLTISDFLEEYLIRLVYPINRDSFFDGNVEYKMHDKKGYLLPIKANFFNYFSPSYLEEKDGKVPHFEMEECGNAIRVTLRIRVQNGRYIEYQRMYYAMQADYLPVKPNVAENKGAIIETWFGLSIFPFYRLENRETEYRVRLLDCDVEDTLKKIPCCYQLGFFKFQSEHEFVPVKSDSVTRSEKVVTGRTSVYYILEENFDFIQIKNHWGTGILLPKFAIKRSNKNEEYTFAIDFGTSNTHIAYHNNGIYPFEILEGEAQFATLHGKNTDFAKLHDIGAQYVYDKYPIEFLPSVIKDEFKFPMRTAITHNANFDLRNTKGLAHMNIAYCYEKNFFPPHMRVKTNIKWANDSNANEESYYKAFFDQLLMTIRNKVVLNDGDLDNTKLVWFFPSSMPTKLQKKMEDAWKESFGTYISDKDVDDKVIRIPESLAPFKYYASEQKVTASHRPVLMMDIGGGTTDVVIYKGNKPEILTSFRFAGNSIFGDGFNGNKKLNGFYMRFASKYFGELDYNKLIELKKIMGEMMGNSNIKSEDVVNFLFSLENNKEVKEKGIDLSFSKELIRNNEFIFIFLLFYHAIIYHLASMMKQCGMDTPHYLLLSGTGSKILQIIDSSKKFELLTEITEFIFAEVMGEENEIVIKTDDSPKELTCKGGLKMATAFNSEDELNPKEIKKIIKRKTMILFGDDKRTLLGGDEDTMTYEEAYGKVQCIESEVDKCLKMFVKAGRELDFNDSFGISKSLIDELVDIIRKNAQEYVKLGLDTRKDEQKGFLEEDVEESLFFYPFIAGLNEIAYHIASKKQS